MTIKRVTGILLIIITSGWTNESLPSAKLLEYCNVFRQIQVDVRDCVISPDSATRAFQENMKNLRAVFARDSCRSIDSTYFVFPVRCYLPAESIGGRGRGYRPDGFDLFDMEVKGSHPAHDIFIRDKDKDQIDDRTWKPVDILAFTSGVVLAVEKDWQYDSDRRGGNWIWIYDPCLDGLFYYAHNNVVEVQPGQWVNAGDKIAEMGRSGYNAYKKRSPTHLHLMFLKLTPEGLPEPQNTYDWMMMAAVKE
ncbi:hypothetical protein DYBT9275_03790 [Dyadobacter sp. CECT 9275]|uniref:M23ase beta-sheet core domain-containing protein n=1 Tax=Dyadobacter helix TaxID=2822344 RepID=A0A916N706_9BACT|nr:M23 family metallopeptidase [Dyadobacter sp. CECT 9275]CAG5006303.1 hypothetical protein DYBT9275_03790 [Dyadobacter sp. CECT 9275]